MPLGERAELLARYDASGAPAWVRQLDGTDQATLSATAPAPDGGLYAVGSGDVLSSFDGEAPLGDRGEADALIARFGSDGALLWQHTLGSAGDDVISAVTALPDGFLVGGSYAGEITLGEGEPGEITLSLQEGASAAGLLARYRADGTLVWASSIHAGGSAYVDALGYDSVTDTLSVIGSLDGYTETVFGEGLPSERSFIPGDYAFFVATFEGNGALRWVSFANASSPLYTNGADTLPGGALLVAGTTYGQALLDRAGPSEQPVGEGNIPTAWLARYEPDGQISWSSAARGESSYSVDVIALPTGGAALLASFDGLLSLGEGGEARHFINADGRDGLLAVLSPDGSLDCAVVLETIDGEESNYLTPEDLHLRDDGGIDIVGRSSGEMVFGRGLGSEVTLLSEEDAAFWLTLDLLPR